MNIAVYYDVPFGGAHVSMEEILKRLRPHHRIEIYHNQKNSLTQLAPKRFWLDLESILFQRFKQKHQASIIDREKFDLVFVSHDRHSQAPWLLRFLKTPTVFLCQEPTRAYFEQFLRIDPQLPLHKRCYEAINRFLRRQIEIKNASFAHVVLANSIYSTESIFRAYGRQATPVYLGIDKSDYYRESITKKNQIFVVGNHEPQKALPLAIEAVSLIGKSIRPKLVIASPRQTDSSELMSMARKLKVNLEIKVGLNRDRLRGEYCQSKITLALAHLEPFGLSVIESLACGTPVIAVNEGGFRETVVNNKSGLLVDRDPASVAQAIVKLLGDTSLAKSLGLFGLKDVHSRFTWGTTVSKIEKIFYETA